MVMLPKAHLLEVLQAGSDTPLDEASAALALLVEAGQYDDVIRYGNPLLKAASAALPNSSTSAKAAKPPVPNLEHLAADLALSVALAHVSLAAGPGAPSGSPVGPLSAAAGSAGVLGAAASSGSNALGLEELYGHLEAALQVLARHGVADALQQEVAYCLQNVALALAEELLRGTPPVARPAPQTSPGGAAAGPTAAAHDASGASAAARRTRAIGLLRGALWKTASNQPAGFNGHNGHNGAQHEASIGGSHGQREQLPGGGAAAHVPTGAPAAAPTVASGSGAASGGFWPPELTSEERCELLAPLRGLMTAAEHIALYGPVASAQKPYAAVGLSDQELYDLAVAHLAQGVTSGWPQHVLQALSYFERVAQQQQQQQQGGSPALGAAPAALGPAAADVSFERSVCEALLGRRSSAADSVAAEAQPQATTAAAGAASPMKSLDLDEWDFEGADEAALLRRLEAHLAAAAAGGGGASGEQQVLLRQGEAAVAFSVKESPNTSIESDDERAAAPQLASTPSAGVARAAAGAAAQPAKGDRAAAAAAKGADASRRYGWAESWLELSVMPCFPETAGGGSGSVSLARWFADPRVILFNKLLAVRSSEAQVTAALGSAVAHVSDASRQRLWQLWQAAANAVAGAAAVATKGTQAAQPAAAAAGAAATSPTPAPASPVAAATGPSGGGGSGGGMSPVAGGLLAQSRAALQDVAPRAAAAANAVAAAAAALGTAAASSPRAVAAAANWMVRRGPAAAAASPGAVLVGSGTDRMGRASTGATAAALPPQAAAAGAATSSDGVEAKTGSGAAVAPLVVVPVSEEEADLQRQQANGDNGATPGTTGPKSNNVVPFASTAGVSGAIGDGTSPLAAVTAGSGSGSPSSPAAQPVASGLMDVTAAPPPAGAAAPSAAAAVAGAVGSNADDRAAAAVSGVDALWVPDAEGHLRPRMVARVVQDAAAAAAASLKERVAALPEWRLAELAAMDEAQAREAMRRVAAVAAQAVCLGALAAFVGHRIVASGALQAAAGGGPAAAPGGGDRALAAVVAMDASSVHAAAAARAVGKWLRGVTAAVAAAAPGSPGASRPRIGGGGGVEVAMLAADTMTVESVGRLAALVGSESRLGEANAAALLRGWAAARAAAPGLADPRDRRELLGGLLSGRALRRARAEADRDARLGRRVAVQRLDVEVERMRVGEQAPSSSSEPQEVAVTAVVVTAGTQASRAAPLPEAFTSTERLAVTFRREPGGAAGAGSAGGVWRLVDVRDAPPALY